MNSALQKTRIWSSTHDDDQIDRLSKLTNLKYHKFAPAIRCISRGKYSESHGEGDGEFGIGVLSRFPILDTKVITFKPYEKKTPRNALAVLLDLSGGGWGEVRNAETSFNSVKKTFICVTILTQHYIPFATRLFSHLRLSGSFAPTWGATPAPSSCSRPSNCSISRRISA